MTLGFSGKQGAVRGGAKRKRRQLLMEPPPSPPPPASAERRRSDSSSDTGNSSPARLDGGREHHYRLATSDSSAPCSRTTTRDNMENDDRRATAGEHKFLAATTKLTDFKANLRLSFSSAPTATTATSFAARNRKHQTDQRFVINNNQGHADQMNQTSQQQRHNMASTQSPFKTCQQQQQQQQQQRAKSRRKGELSSFLTILFGSLLFALVALSLTQCHQSNNSTTSGTVSISSRSTPSSLVASATKVASRTDNEDTEPSKSTSAPTTDGDKASSDSASEPASDLAPDDDGGDGDETQADNQAAAAAPKLRELLADSASSGVDLLISRLSTTEAPSALAGDGEDVEGSATTENELESETSAANNETASQPTHQAGGGGGGKAAKLALAGEPQAGEVLFGPEHETNRFAMETWLKWRAAGDDLIELFSRKLLPVIMRHGYDVDASTVSGLLQVFNGIRGLKPWAVKLLDASTKLAPGVLLGTQSDFGDFDECLNIRVDDPSGFEASNADYPVSIDAETGLKSTTLVGRYCLADVEFPKPARGLRSAEDRARQAGVSANQSEAATFEHHLPIELRKPLLDFAQTAAFKDTIFVETGNFFHMLYVDPIRVGVCLTNKIDPNSFAQVFNKLIEEFAISIHFRGRCVTKYDKPKWTTYQRYSAYILLTACSLVALSTLLDLLQLKLNKLPWLARYEQARVRLALGALRYRPLYTSFSLLRNTKRLFKPQKAPIEHQAALGQGNHFKTNLALHMHAEGGSTSAQSSSSSSSTSCKKGKKQSSGSSVGSSPSLATTTSSIPDSSVESSPAIERRSSTVPLVEGHHHHHHHQLAAAGSKTQNANPTIDELLLLNEHRKLNAADTNKQPVARQQDYGHKMRDSNGISLMSLHGIRVITMVWMIVNHTYMFGGFFVLWAHRRLIDIAEWPKSLSFQMVLNGWLTVETYFFLSALIIVLNVMPLMRSAKFNYFTYILHRLVRLLPAYVGLVCLNFLWPLVSSGPVWLVKGKSFVQTPCENYLWANFLFVNNWIWPEKQCMVHTWFLSADFQLYILAPIIVYLLYRRPALGHTLNILVAILASILSGFVIYANKLLPTTLINKLEFDAIKQQLSYSYFATYQHMGPYCLGILTGYLLHKRPHIHLPKYLTWLLWLLLPPLSFTTLLLTYLWNGAYDDPALINPSPLVSAFYVAIHRTIWTALVAWLVFACTTGRAKLLNQFLSHSIFVPISRLSYSIYLVHLPIIMFRSLNLRHTVEWTDQNILYDACGNFVASLFMGYFLNVAFESPMINLENYISGRDRVRRSPQPTGNNLTTTYGAPTKLASNGEPLTPDGDSSSAAGETSSSTSQSVAESPPINKHASLGQFEAKAAQGGQQQQQQFGANKSQRKSLRPKQASSVERIFGEIQATSASHQSRGHFDTPSSSSTCSNQSVDEFGEPQSQAAGQDGIQEIQPFGTRPANQEQQQQQQQLRNKMMRERLMGKQNQAAHPKANHKISDQQQNNLYNYSSNEYNHYAPAGYRQWRMYMNGQVPLSNTGGGGGPNYSRPMHYATLARTSRLSQQDRPTLDRSHRLRAYDDDDDVDDHDDRMLSFGGNYANSDMIARHNHASTTDHQSLGGGGGGARLVGDDSDMQARNGRRPFNLAAPLQSPARLQPGRYNTLTGTRSRDLRQQHELSSASQLASDNQNWLASRRVRGEHWVDTESSAMMQLRRPPPGELLTGVDSSWLRHSPMIPRIDSSTLRRQTRRSVDNTAANSIVEETTDQGAETESRDGQISNL